MVSVKARAEPARVIVDELQVAAARGGDRAAFGKLFEQFAPMVHGILLARVAPADADDLLQEVFLTALEKIAALRDAGAVGAWLAMIARNLATDGQRARRPTAPLPRDLATYDAPKSEAAEVLAIIRTLPEAYREPLVLRLVEGMSGPEIAERVGLTPESVRVNLHRGMQQLRARLGLETDHE
ncbi:MAG TPA: sigma-70 family RNA polymerase sigma factor [Polyangia bacterium]|nr:sigma-70 family RNA polymerase sigma factor [Polyangia bacterium]